jgi:metal-responsive CopG/Arc/MetJ family transcriptional regulator
MPRAGPVRPIVGIRLGAEWVAAVDALAAVAGVGRSEMVRRLIMEALVARGIGPT